MKVFVLLALTLFLSCNNTAKKLPILSYKIDESGIKNHYKITYKGFTNQLGKPFEIEDNKIYISNFFFTRCPSICPPMRTELISVAEEFSEENNVIFISHTIDPKHDSTPILKAYAEATEIPNYKWQFIRASEEKTKLQAEMYMTNFKPNEDGSDFYHSSFATLIDQKQQIRGFYNVLVKEDVVRLKGDIKQLLE